MHIIECYIDSGGFDYKLIKGGTSVYIWNLARKFNAFGHQVSIIMAAHGQIDYLKSKYDLKKIPFTFQYKLPLMLDVSKWKDFPESLEINLTTEAYMLSIENINIYFLSNEYLNKHPDTFYPPYELKGKDLSFFKPLIFQIDAIKFIKAYLGSEEKCVIHTHEPLYQYLLPIAFKDSPEKIVVSTVQSNMPVNKKIYKPKLQRLLQFLNIDLDLAEFDDKLDDRDDYTNCMREFLPETHLFYDYPVEHYINFYSLILRYSDLIDFLSPGQKFFYSTFRDTAFEKLFNKLTVSQLIKENYSKFFVGWCAISDKWFESIPQKVDRDEVLRSLGLNPQYPTFFHNARYAVEHKGQIELMQAVEKVLSENCKANFILRFISEVGIDNEYFHKVKRKFSHNIYLEWSLQEEERIIQYTKASDFCLFPSKFEMDTFLIAQGEAMLSGAVPIATAQEGMRHWLHSNDIHQEGTGFSLYRSFSEKDPLLVQNLTAKIQEAITLYFNDKERYKRLSANAKRVANRYTWKNSAKAHLEYMEKAYYGETLKTDLGDILDNGWFDLLDEEVIQKNSETVKKKLINRGCIEIYRKHFPMTDQVYEALYESAYTLADFDNCMIIARLQNREDKKKNIMERISITETMIGTEIVYNYTLAHRVELFIKNELIDTVPSGYESKKFQDFTGIVLHTTNGSFKTVIKVKDNKLELFFLLTLINGRVTWDKFVQ